MKKILFLILVFLILICSQSYAANRYGCTALTGGGTGALDALDITASGAPNSDDLADGDSAIVTVISGTTVTVYEYIFDADGTDAESSPNVIRPDDYSSGGVWRLVKIHEDMVPDLSSTYQPADSDLDSLASGISGLVKGAGNGSGYSAATDGTDYWSPTSDGSGSGLDADTLDGIQASDLGNATNIGITSGDNYTNFGDSADDSINELFEAIDNSWPSGSGAPTDAEYVTLSTNATLSAERVLTEGTALDITDGGAGGNVTIAFDPTEITDTTWGANTDTSQVWTWDTGTGTDPSLTVTDDAFTFNKKVVASGIETSGSSSGPQLVWFLEDSDNGSNYVGWGSPASNDNDLIFLLPTSDPTANQILGFAAPSSVTFSDGTARDATQASWLSFGSDFSISGGTVSIASGVIVDADINASAGIDATKIAGGSVDNTEFSYLDGVTSAIQTQLDAKAPLASPALTGDPTAPTPSANDNDTSIATTAYVQGELTAYNSDTVTLTNKTIDADNNTITNIDAEAVKAILKSEGCTVNLGNGSDAISTGTKWTRAFKVPFKHDLTSITVTTNETSGSITIDVWKDVAGDTNGLANITDADSLFDTASEPAISDASSDNTVEVTSFDSGEATDVAADTWYVINVDSASTLTFVAVSFEFTRKD